MSITNSYSFVNSNPAPSAGSALSDASLANMSLRETIQYAKKRGFIKIVPPSLQTMPQILQIEILKYLLITSNEANENRHDNYLTTFNNRSIFKSCKELRKLEVHLLKGNGDAVSDILYKAHYDLSRLPAKLQNELKSIGNTIQHLNLSHRPGSTQLVWTVSMMNKIVEFFSMLEKLNLNDNDDRFEEGFFTALLPLKGHLRILTINNVWLGENKSSYKNFIELMAQCTYLKSLEMDRCILTATELQHIQKLTRLETLTLGGFQELTGLTLKNEFAATTLALKNLKAFATASLGIMSIEMAQYIPNWKQLESLKIHLGEANDTTDVSFLRKCKNLHTLKLSLPFLLTAAQLQQLKGDGKSFSELKELCLHASDSNLELAHLLESMPNLKNLTLLSIDAHTGNALIALKHLDTLTVAGSKNQANWSWIQKLESLGTLFLDDLWGESQEVLETLPRLEGIKSCRIYDNSAPLTVEQLNILAIKMPYLESLTLSCDTIRDEELNALTQLKKLRYLELSSLSISLTEQAVTFLKELPYLKTLFIFQEPDQQAEKEDKIRQPIFTEAARRYLKENIPQLVLLTK
ncbi:MAG: hypothetical protein JWO53_802 [Chlamydiia bacterium]|nr:hypothetical protein [Chlamydiia bacterium]